MIEKDIDVLKLAIDTFVLNLRDNNKKVDSKIIKKIYDSVNKLTQDECDKVNAYCEINMFDIKDLKQIEDFIINIDNYQILGESSLEDVGIRLTNIEGNYYVNNSIKKYVNYEKLARDYMKKKNITGEICSYGFLIDTRDMFTNSLIEPTVPKDKILSIVVVNKDEYEKKDDYRSITIFLPSTEEEIKRKLKCIGVDYDNLTIQDTHTIDCYLVNYEDEDIIDRFNYYICKLISDFSYKNGYTTPLQEMQLLCNEISKLDNVSMRKYMALIDTNKFEYMGDVVNLAKKINKYELLYDVKNYYDMGKYLVEETGHFDEVGLLNAFIDYEALGRCYTQKGYTYNGTFTDFGYLIKKEELEKQEEEEFE